MPSNGYVDEKDLDIIYHDRNDIENKKDIKQAVVEEEEHQTSTFMSPTQQDKSHSGQVTLKCNQIYRKH
jgi:hypothetical protein